MSQEKSPVDQVVVPRNLPHEMRGLLSGSTYTVISIRDKRQLYCTNCSFVAYDEAHDRKASLYFYDGRLAKTYEGEIGD